MKRLAVLSIFQLLFAAVVMAQAQIGSFYGLRLGMTISEVRSALRSQGSTMEEKSDYIIVKKAILGDFTFDWLRLDVNFPHIRKHRAKIDNILPVSIRIPTRVFLTCRLCSSAFPV